MDASNEAPAAVADHRPGERAAEWPVYADATLAGLSALVPLPLLDLAFEAVFRRRMARAIARHRGVEVAPRHLKRLAKGEPWLSLAGCLVLPFKILRWVLLKVFRKLVYPLAMVDAARQVGEYWHRARLVDHILSSRHLEHDPERAFAAFTRALDEADISPIRGAAEEVVRSARRVGRTLLRAMRRGGSRPPDTLGGPLGASWGRVQGSLDRLVAEYESLYRTGSGSATTTGTGSGSG